MTRRMMASAGPFIVAVAVLMLTPLRVATQDHAGYTPPRTPWGDPDLQGSYTNKSEQGTPFERPKEFEGRRLEDVKGKELADILRARQERVIENARPAG